MSKNEKAKLLLDWKTGKRFALIGGILLTMSGAAFSCNHAGHVKAATGDQETIIWEPGKALAHFKLSDGSTGEATQLLRKSDKKPTYCIGLGVPLSDNSIAAQEDAMNKIWVKLSSEEQDIVNNISYLANKQGAKTNMDLYLGAQLAEWKILHEAGASEKDVTTIESFGDGNPNGSVDKVNKYRDDLIKQAKQLVKKPSFDGKTISLIMGVPKTTNDDNAALVNFPRVKNNAEGLTEKIDKNSLTLTANISSKTGIIKNALQFMNESQDKDYQPFVYSTGGDSTGDTSQSVFIGTDPSRLLSSLNVNVIGLGESTLLKQDEETKSTDTQGKASLIGSVWGLYKAGTDTLVKYSDGQKGYPITVTAGEKVDNDTVQLKMTDLTKGVGYKNGDNSQDVEWGEISAPEGYERTTKRYKVHYDDKSKFDDKTSNYIENVTATDHVLDYGFGFIKAQDVNGSYTGLNGRTFRYTPTNGTKGEPIEVTSGSSEDSNGVTQNGQVSFPKIPFGDGLLEELPKEGDTLQLINPISITHTTDKDKEGKITGYTFEFKDTVTKQVITTLNIPTTKTVDNYKMFNVNLGTLVDKPVTPVVPTIKTNAHTEDGGQILKVKDLSKSTPMYDKVMLTNSEKGDVQHGYLHRIVKDSKGKVVTDKIISENKFVIDDESAKKQEDEILAKVDTTGDANLPEGQTVKYVWTEKLNDSSDKHEKAKHDDLNDQDETITVEKETPKTPVTPANHLTINLPNTGSKVMGLLSVVGVIVLAALGGIATYLIKKNKKKSAE